MRRTQQRPSLNIILYSKSTHPDRFDLQKERNKGVYTRGGYTRNTSNYKIKETQIYWYNIVWCNKVIQCGHVYLLLPVQYMYMYMYRLPVVGGKLTKINMSYRYLRIPSEFCQELKLLPADSVCRTGRYLACFRFGASTGSIIYIQY